MRAAYKRLDYNNGDFLAHYQWRVMQDSVMFVWKVLQDDEDGMSENKKIVAYRSKLLMLLKKMYLSH